MEAENEVRAKQRAEQGREEVTDRRKQGVEKQENSQGIQGS